jgi:hypothetical protein
VVLAFARGRHANELEIRPAPIFIADLATDQDGLQCQCARQGKQWLRALGSAKIVLDDLLHKARNAQEV